MIPPWISVEQNGGATKEEYILFVGRLVREKGVETLIRASAQSGVSIRVVGDGPLGPALASLIASSGANVELAGWRSHDEVLAEVSRAKALVVPSVWPEIFGLVICEAFAAGVPVIGSDIGAITGLLSGERGYLFPPGDVGRLSALLREVSDDQVGAATRAENARRYAQEHLTYQRWRDQYREVYTDLSAA
jgi:glycosyltransferase involved in cell wall biosynthesis